MSWQMKRCLDTLELDLVGKIGAVFASGMGGGGYELTELTLIAALLIRGMLVYSGALAGAIRRCISGLFPTMLPTATIGTCA